MATITEVRQKLVQGGMNPTEAQKAAQILADMPAFTAPAGGMWDTLSAKGFQPMSRPLNSQVRFLSNPKDMIIVLTVDGLNTLFKQCALGDI